MNEPDGTHEGPELSPTQVEVEFAPLLAQIGRIMTSASDIDEVYERFTEAGDVGDPGGSAVDRGGR